MIFDRRVSLPIDYKRVYKVKFSISFLFIFFLFFLCVSITRDGGVSMQIKQTLKISNLRGCVQVYGWNGAWKLLVWRDHVNLFSLCPSRCTFGSCVHTHRFDDPIGQIKRSPDQPNCCRGLEFLFVSEFSCSLIYRWNFYQKNMYSRAVEFFTNITAPKIFHTTRSNKKRLAFFFLYE